MSSHKLAINLRLYLMQHMGMNAVSVPTIAKISLQIVYEWLTIQIDLRYKNKKCNKM